MNPCPYLKAFLGVHLTRFRTAMREGDRGASAVELAVITAVILAIAFALLAVIRTFVTSQSANITNNNQNGG